MVLKNDGLMVVFSGPSGAGKGTVLKILTEDSGYILSTSATTRPPRPGEVHGREYFFYSEEEFIKRRDNDELLEYTEYNGYYYGTPREYVEGQIASGKIIILEIEVTGAQQIKQKFGDSILIFMMPPDKNELARRLISRMTQTQKSVLERLATADREVKNIVDYDYLVINDYVENAVEKIRAIVTAEKLRVHRNLRRIDSFLGEGAI